MSDLATAALARRRHRAAHYRQQAERLREMAEDERDAPFRVDLLELARQYESVADRLHPAQ